MLTPALANISLQRPICHFRFHDTTFAFKSPKHLAACALECWRDGVGLFDSQAQRLRHVRAKRSLGFNNACCLETTDVDSVDLECLLGSSGPLLDPSSQRKRGSSSLVAFKKAETPLFCCFIRRTVKISVPMIAQNPPIHDLQLWTAPSWESSPPLV